MHIIGDKKLLITSGTYGVRIYNIGKDIDKEGTSIFTNDKDSYT